MTDQRPDPDALLRELKLKEETRTGKLKIFFGYAAGWARPTPCWRPPTTPRRWAWTWWPGTSSRTSGRKPWLCWTGWNSSPTRRSPYKNITLREFDLDGALARKPQLILVDELAHTNAAGSRHRKRYQDIEELLEHGINVYTTVNIQHLESLNDNVTGITSVMVRETIPDRVFDRADQVKTCGY